MDSESNLDNVTTFIDSPERGAKVLDIKNASGNKQKSKFLSYLAFSIAFFAVFVAIFVLCMVFRAEYKPLEQQRNEYLNMINNAKEHAICNLKGTVTSFDIDEKTGYYVFGYRVVSESGAGGQLDAFSPYVYTREDIETNYPNGSEVKIAVESGLLSQKTKSVNMDYADYDIMKYAPYKKALVGYVTFLIATAVCFFIVCCFFGFSMIALHKMRKGIDDDEDEKLEVVKPNGTRVIK